MASTYLPTNNQEYYTGAIWIIFLLDIFRFATGIISEILQSIVNTDGTSCVKRN